MEDGDESSEDSFEFECNNFESKKEKSQMNKMIQSGKDYMMKEEGEQFDEEAAEMFAKVLPGEGDEFMAVKPWKGAIKEPIPKPKIDKTKPKTEYEIDWVYGYRSDEGRMNLFFNQEGHAVYPTAALGVIYNYKELK